MEGRRGEEGVCSYKRLLSEEDCATLHSKPLCSGGVIPAPSSSRGQFISLHCLLNPNKDWLIHLLPMVIGSKTRLKYGSQLIRKARLDSEHGTALPLPCINYLSSLGLKLEKQPRRCLGVGGEEWGKFTRSPGKTAPGRTLDRPRP